MKSSVGLKSSRSLSDLGDRKAFDVKVGFHRKRIPPISTNRYPQKAVVITMYRNGDSYFPGTKVSFRPGKDFMPGFCEYLSQRLKIPEGVRYIFDLNGGLINSLEELMDGGTYVASGTKTFKDIPYGKLARIKTGPIIPNPIPLRPDEVLLYRRPDIDRLSKASSRLTNVSVTPDENISLPGSRESCVVTVVNKREPAKRSRVLLNLKTKQSWEDVIRDMGQAIGMKNRASKMLTPWGEEVRSFSHLKNEFGDVETFYLDIDNRDGAEPRRRRSDPQVKGENSGFLRIRIPEESKQRWAPG